MPQNVFKGICLFGKCEEIRINLKYEMIQNVMESLESESKEQKLNLLDPMVVLAGT